MPDDQCAHANWEERGGYLRCCDCGTWLDETATRLTQLQAALNAIAERDWVENCLNPQWPAETARAALARQDG